jgi:hypothetical protein
VFGARSGTLTVTTSNGNLTASLRGAGVQPVTVTPTSLTFSAQALGTISAGQTVTLTNNQTTTLTITSITSSAADFGNTTSCPLSPSTLAPGARCAASLTFSPRAVGTRTAMLSFIDGVSNSPQTVSLSGTGNPAALTAISVTPASASIAAGASQQFTATGTYSDGSTQDLSGSVLWSSSAASVASISSVGLVTGLAQGSTTIGAASGSISGSASLTITAAQLSSITLAPSVITLTTGTTQQFTATGLYSDGTTQDLTNSSTWASSGAPATVTSSGLATAAAMGSATITATVGALSGSGILISTVPGAPTVFPAGIHFPPQPSGTTSRPQTATVYNLGLDTVVLTSVSVTGSAFQMTSGTVPITLAPKAYSNFKFTVTPSDAKKVSGSAKFTFDHAPSQTVPLNALGTSEDAVAILSTSSVVFDDQSIGTVSGAQTVTITNVGSISFGLTRLTVMPPFFQSGFDNKVTLAPGVSFSFALHFAPSLPGAATGAVQIAYDRLPNQGISLAGTATGATSLRVTNFPTLPAATQGAAYEAFLTASGGVEGTLWALSSGSSLPAGLSLSGQGVITGTLSPSVPPGSHSFTVQVTDSGVPPATSSALLTVPVGPPTGAVCDNISWNAAGTTSPLMALGDLGASYYGGYQGGLYADGSNTDDPIHHWYGLTMSQAIQPLDFAGSPSPTGNYALLSLGHSNSDSTFDEFVMWAVSDPATNPSLVVVNGAKGNESADILQDPDSYFWNLISYNDLPNAGVTADQVEVPWLNDVDVSHPATIENLQAMVENILRLLPGKFPNLKLVYLSSVNYTAYSNGIKNFQAEPSAYEAGFSMKAAIQDQVNGVNNLNYDPAKGPVVAPWSAWGPYYWTNGLLSRSDGLTWSCQDAASDGTHPSYAGRLKGTAQLLNFFKTDETASTWFLAH